jgi:membrane protein required for colicin V production
MNLGTLDLVIVVIVGISTLLSFFRGFFGEFLSLAGWLFAIGMPLFFTHEFAAFLPASIESPTARVSVSAATLFIGSLVASTIMTFLLRRVLSVAGLSIADRILGSGFGLVRGVVIVALIALAATASVSIPQEKWWNESALLPHFMRVSKFIHGRLPPEIARRFHINDT